ncbi:hypothetical protein BFL35_13525 [Clavibacter michiganensis]|nr:hypothetical protein BFL35_13525 [Clavibacter michiganensis]
MSAVVSADSGGLSGTTWMIAVSTDGFGVPAPTNATSSRPRISSPMSFSTPIGSVVCVMSTSTTSGPLWPGPNASETVSYATRLVDPAGSVAPLGRPSCSCDAGTARSPAMPMTITTGMIGTFVTTSTQRAPSVRCVPSACAVARRAAREPSFGRSRSPARPSMAGSSVVATPIASSTAKAAPSPITVRNGICTTSSPSSAMITVTPAKITALPAVATAVAAERSTGMPLASCVRCRMRMNRA